MADRMTFFKSYYEAIMLIADPVDRLKAFEAICGYGITGDEPSDLDGIAKMLFVAVKPTIEASGARRDGGAKGGSSKNKVACENDESYLDENDEATLQKSDKLPCEKCVSEKDKEEEKDKEKDKDTQTRARFVPPSADEVEAYCTERGNGIDAQEFIDHYEANGWMRGKNKIKDWRACVRTWEAKRGFKIAPDTSPPENTGSGVDRIPIPGDLDTLNMRLIEGYVQDASGPWLIRPPTV